MLRRALWTGLVLAGCAPACIAQSGNDGYSTTQVTLGGDAADGYAAYASVTIYYGMCEASGDGEVDVWLGNYYSESNDQVFTDPYPFGPGTYVAQALYYGDSGITGQGAECNISGSSGSATLVVPMVQPDVGFTPPSSPIPSGELFSFPVLVEVPNQYVVPEPPTGTVSLYYGSQKVAALKLGIDPTGQNGAVAFSLATKGLPQGSYSLQIVYSGDANYYPVTSSPFNVKIGPSLAATHTTLSAVPNPVILGNSITLAAQVAPQVNGLPITGTVAFSAGTLQLGRATVNSSGIASLTLTAQGVSPGVYSVLATYSGNGHYAGSSTTGTVTVISQGTTTTAVSAYPQSQIQGQTVGITVAVTAGQGDPPPSGTVTLTSGNSVLANLSLYAGGAGYNFSTAGLPGGSYLVTAAYNGSSTYKSSAAETEIEIIPGVSLTASANPDPVTKGDNTIFTAQVSPDAGNGGKLPTGSVTFGYGEATLGSGNLSSSGAVTVPIGTAGLPAGTDVITATYSGDATFAGSSATVGLVVQ